jgi:hypothetical protein
MSRMGESLAQRAGVRLMPAPEDTPKDQDRCQGAHDDHYVEVSDFVGNGIGHGASEKAGSVSAGCNYPRSWKPAFLPSSVQDADEVLCEMRRHAVGGCVGDDEREGNEHAPWKKY